MKAGTAVKIRATAKSAPAAKSAARHLKRDLGMGVPFVAMIR